MRILTIQERIELGQAKNQATEILAQIWTKIIPSEREELYKKAVRQIYQWNLDINKEFEDKEIGQQHQDSISTPKLHQQSQSPSSYPQHEKGKYGERR